MQTRTATLGHVRHGKVTKIVHYQVMRLTPALWSCRAYEVEGPR
jgi:hypothetical protein